MLFSTTTYPEGGENWRAGGAGIRRDPSWRLILPAGHTSWTLILYAEVMRWMWISSPIRPDSGVVGCSESKELANGSSPVAISPSSPGSKMRGLLYFCPSFS